MFIRKLSGMTTHTLKEADVVGVVHIPRWCFWWWKWKHDHAVIVIKRWKVGK
jgi:hypothetical protein